MRELMNLRHFHPLWIWVPALATIVVAALIWWIATYGVAHLDPHTPPPAPPVPAARLPEPDSGDPAAGALVRNLAGDAAFTPPKREDLPEGPFGDVIRFGRDIFVNTQDYAKRYVGNGLNCVNCHLDEGRKANAGGKYAFPPLWGKDSYNGGAGMHRVETAAAFIRANMPLGKPGSRSVQEAWDVAQFVNSHERPRDPRKRPPRSQSRFG